MFFYKVKFLAIPEIKFAGTVRTEKYKNIISDRKNIIEIGIVNGGSVCVSSEKETWITPRSYFSCLFPDANLHLKASSNNLLYMSFAAITGNFEFEKLNTKDISSTSDFLKSTEKDILLPFFFDLDSKFTETERLLRLLISEYLKETAEGKLRALSLWFEVAANISELFKQSLLNESAFNYGEYYSRKVKRYIENHYQTKINIRDIASELGITPNYLSRIFKESTGKTITEFINLTRLYHARRLAYDKTLKFEQIAKQVGICDIYYLNRLFKKYHGTSLNYCRMTDHEISLYHDKPWDIDNLSEDIYKG